MEGNPKKKTQKKQSKFAIWFRWPLIVLVTSFCLSMAFGVLSEIALTNASIIISVIVILVFLVIAIVTDMIGVAIATCDEKPFRAMDARKIRGAKEAIMLVKNADRVSSIIADILGDVCSILSGAAGASVTAALINDSMTPMLTVVIASLVSAVIAALIISGKALMKRYSMIHCEKIILILGKLVSLFHFTRKKDKKISKNKITKSANLEKTQSQKSLNESNEAQNQEAQNQNEIIEKSDNKDNNNNQGDNLEITGKETNIIENQIGDDKQVK